MGILKHFFKYYYGSAKEGGVENFSLLHFTWFTVILALMAFMIFVYKKITEESKRKMLEVCAGTLVFIYFLRIIWAALLGKFRADSMLPFHLCGIMVFIEFFAVFLNYNLLKEFAYSAGLPGAFMALLTPELNGYPLFSFQYQVFILTHALLVLLPLLWVTSHDFRPNKKYIMKVYGVLSGLAAIDFVINKFLNSNYMFISKAPINTPFVIIEKYFGYKGYICFLLISVFLMLNLMYLPWSMKSGHTKDGNSLVGANN